MRNPNVSSRVSRVDRRKRRAGFLLTYWATALIIGVLQPCCESIAAAVPHDHEATAAAGKATVAAQEMSTHNHGVGNHDRAIAADQANTQSSPEHVHCQGIEAFHNLPAVTSSMLTFVDGDEKKPPSLTSLNSSAVFAGYEFAVNWNRYSNVHTSSPPIYLRTLRLRL